ncbi:TPA: hypothetical protein PXM28_002445 [Yersinia enterocolitica]|nr:hypothetical protein [Yersinia enterocolitica]
MDIIFQVAGVLAVFWSIKSRHWNSSSSGLVCNLIAAVSFYYPAPQ